MSNETKQTAVDFYAKQLEILGDKVFKIGLTLDEFRVQKHELFEQAKEMEKERMMQSYSDGLGNGMAVGRGECSFESVADEKEYLIKTYGGNK